MAVTVLDQQLGFSSIEACAAAGVTYRMADNWVRAGAITPSITSAAGHGSRRCWSMADVERLTRIGRVIDRAERAGLLVTCAAIAAMWDALEAGDPWSMTLTA
jgi:DNA-binding transcriptional MerR regulator